MPYRDKGKQREAMKKVMQKKRGITEDVIPSVSSVSVIPKTDVIPSVIPSLESLKSHLKDPVYYAKLRAIRDGLKSGNQLDQVMIGVDGLTFVEVDKLITIMG